MVAALSLGPVLDLIERWQAENPPYPETCQCAQCVNRKEMHALDIRDIRQLAEQHAAQLRACAGDAEGPMFNEWRAIANFLCASRREPEAE